MEALKETWRIVIEALVAPTAGGAGRGVRPPIDREAFVVAEIYRVLLVSMLSFFALKLLARYLSAPPGGYNTSLTKAVRVTIESVLFLVLPCLAVLYPSTLAHPTVLMVVASFLLTLGFPKRHDVIRMTPWIEDLNAPGAKPMITVYRCWTIVLTCFAILAVDFTVFPTRFAKSETFGATLMDLGVGIAVFAQGLVSGLRRNSQSSNPSVIASARRSLPLWLLGFLRLALTKATNYNVHVAEYGVHWNFFFTLAAVGPLIAVLKSLTHLGNGPLAVFVTFAYEAYLFLFSGSEYIRTAPRIDLFSSNREGLLSLFGYAAILLFANHTGTWLARKRDSIDDWRTAGSAMVMTGAVLSYLVHYRWESTLLDPISRRMANAGFVVWMVAFNVGALGLLLLIDCWIYVPIKSCTFVVAEALNSNGMLVFLLANMLTGIINLSMDTHGASLTVALFVLSSYMGTLVGVALVMKQHGWRLRI